jgi:hypothetical protein
LLARKIERRVARTAISHGKDDAHRRVRSGRSLIGNGFLVKKNFSARCEGVRFDYRRPPRPARVSRVSSGTENRSSPIANNVDVKRCCAEICEACRTSHMRRDTQRQVAGSFRHPRSAAAAWPQLRRRRSSVIRARYARAAFAEAASGGTRHFRARLSAHRGARLVATDVKPDDPGMACRPGREPRRMHGVSKPFFACAPGLGRRDAVRRFVANTADVSSQAILPARFPAPACFVTTHKEARHARPLRFARLTTARIRQTRDGIAALEPFNETHAV